MRGPCWSEQDDIDLRRLYVDLTVSREDLERRFGRSWMAIKTRANNFGLYRRSPRPLSSHPWTEAEEQLLRELYPDLNTSREEIARRLGRTWRSVQHRIGHLGITPRKSLTLEWPKVPEPFEMPFLLGYFDGDGSLMQRPGRKSGQYQWHLLGTLPFLTRARECLLKHASIELKPPIRANKKASHHLYLLYAAGQTVAIDRALNASGLGLPRKHIAATHPEYSGL